MKAPSLILSKLWEVSTAEGTNSPPRPIVEVSRSTQVNKLIRSIHPLPYSQDTGVGGYHMNGKQQVGQMETTGKADTIHAVSGFSERHHVFRPCPLREHRQCPSGDFRLRRFPALHELSGNHRSRRKGSDSP